MEEAEEYHQEQHSNDYPTTYADSPEDIGDRNHESCSPIVKRSRNDPDASHTGYDNHVDKLQVWY